ncbi:type II toxin-antitoxin system VapC family toxin [Sphingomonas sp. KC8]|uniref:type II toxin-antitoxin system VapC family toxin n=1 Tax=Sphingomonas sp. KC8 TaxID=1030157 RepID=UPI0002489C78|nr:type II toxin-antitoxin system VapC family toxin [Sphingomonas sp. KC8]ARS29409.1 twitching motility protein PilT [Sphingomonas sp. KC8]
MTSIILDASALLAMLRDEPGGDKVADVLIDSHMCVVNLAEVTGHFVHNDMPPREVDAMLHPLPVTFVAADAELARVAGHLRAATSEAGLSLGDRFCLALAMREGWPAWTADRQWASVAAKIGVDVVVIR